MEFKTLRRCSAAAGAARPLQKLENSCQFCRSRAKPAPPPASSSRAWHPHITFWTEFHNSCSIDCDFGSLKKHALRAPAPRGARIRAPERRPRVRNFLARVFDRARARFALVGFEASGGVFPHILFSLTCYEKKKNNNDSSRAGFQLLMHTVTSASCFTYCDAYCKLGTTRDW